MLQITDTFLPSKNMKCPNHMRREKDRLLCARTMETACLPFLSNVLTIKPWPVQPPRPFPPFSAFTLWGEAAAPRRRLGSGNEETRAPHRCQLHRPFCRDSKFPAQVQAARGGDGAGVHVLQGAPEVRGSAQDRSNVKALRNEKGRQEPSKVLKHKTQTQAQLG